MPVLTVKWSIGVHSVQTEFTFGLVFPDKDETSPGNVVTLLHEWVIKPAGFHFIAEEGIPRIAGVQEGYGRLLGLFARS